MCSSRLNLQGRFDVPALVERLSLARTSYPSAQRGGRDVGEPSPGGYAAGGGDRRSGGAAETQGRRPGVGEVRRCDRVHGLPAAGLCEAFAGGIPPADGAVRRSGPAVHVRGGQPAEGLRGTATARLVHAAVRGRGRDLLPGSGPAGGRAARVHSRPARGVAVRTAKIRDAAASGAAGVSVWLSTLSCCGPGLAAWGLVSSTRSMPASHANRASATTMARRISRRVAGPHEDDPDAAGHEEQRHAVADHDGLPDGQAAVDQLVVEVAAVALEARACR